MFGNIGTGELVIIGIVIMLLFGSKKLPELTKSLTEASKEFKKGLTEEEKPATPITNKKVKTISKEVK